MVKRYFEVVKDEFRKHGNVEIKLPVRGDKRSAGYDFVTPVDIELAPGERKLIFTDVKAFMQDDEVLELHVRSSIGCSGIILQHCTVVILIILRMMEILVYLYGIQVRIQFLLKQEKEYVKVCLKSTL